MIYWYNKHSAIVIIYFQSTTKYQVLHQTVLYAICSIYIVASHSQLHLFCERLGTYTTITTLSCIHLTPWSLFQKPSQFCFMGTYFTVLAFHHVTLGIIYTTMPAIQWTKHHLSGMNQKKKKLVWNLRNYLAVIYESMAKISNVRQWPSS